MKVGDYCTTKKGEAGIIAEQTKTGIVLVLPRVIPATDSTPGLIIGKVKVVLDRIECKEEDVQKIGWIKLKEGK